MLKIRKEQMATFRAAAFKRFEDDMVEHVKEFFPNHYRTAGEPIVRNVIQYGIERSQIYGFITERNMCLYITVMFMLGSNFDTDFFFPWAPVILKDKSETDPSVRADKLADTALDIMKRIAGENNIDINKALLTLSKEHTQIISQNITGNFAIHTKDLLQRLYHRKYAALGDRTIDRLVNEGRRTGADYGITSGNGQILLIVLMFFLGIACDRDPFIPWIKDILTDPAMEDQDKKVKRLYEESVNYIDKWLSKP
ncbi:MAG: hypothetical protein MUP53_07770 [Bacteroidales bacterium]|nr:hypothetical protein [Bacteroidales bacterium]